ncbi:hypothetical protein SEA_AELIN_100 [Mycobacterium phage Aelin]|uniref:Uncharacterized protein n=2 Tax=Pegunavirus manad TaxID=1982929 RepID=A0A899INH2_9CAUD|nr:hypothetical protein SEA_ANTONIA_100 [Mycobacterium phage Antonia]QSM00039.1 hypothetical protein SEA_AELIN_100 [Mycobacterium phage Aelin]
MRPANAHHQPTTTTESRNTMAIHIIIKTGEYQQRVPVEDDAPIYVTVAGESTVDILNSDKTMIDGMLVAQNTLGQISWGDLSAHVARGTHYGSEHGTTDRIAVIDMHGATREDVLETVLWVNRITLPGVI